MMNGSRVLALAAALVAGCTGLTVANAQQSWYRQPAVSPDGQSIVFTAHGDLWRVAVTGGAATALTRNPGWDGAPVWSRDGSQIAFASDRFGDMDVFVMEADGSGLRRLTFHEANDVPSDFSPDGARVLFSSTRVDSADSSYFPTRALPELYEIAVDGGPPALLLTNPAREARWSPDGTRIAYREEKAYENEWRQRDVSSFARDIWVYDLASGKHEQITDNIGGDHTPVWSADGSALYMQSEIDGRTFNVRRVDLTSGESSALTDHDPHPARSLSISDDGLLAYSHHGVLYVVRDGEEPRALEIDLPDDRLSGAMRPLGVNGSITEFAVSADGAEIAFIARGEVFVTDAAFSDTVRITDTPEQERSVSFAPDGRSLLYAGERDGAWAIYETTLTEENEPRFSAATVFEERRVYQAANGDAFQPLYSPDAEKIAFLENRDAIRVIDRDGSNATTIFDAAFNYSYSDGDISFSWSPDSAWVVADYSPRGYYFYTDIGVAPADGSAAPIDISVNGYNDGSPTWHAGGEAILWRSDRFGERTHGSWGSEGDVIVAFLNDGVWARYNLTDQERALLEEHGAPNDEAEDADSEESDEPTIDVNALLNLPEARGDDDPIAIDFESIEHRTVRLTEHSSDLADAAFTEDLSTLYYLAAFEGGYDLWRRDLHEDETKRVASLDADDASLALVPGDETLLILADGRLMQAELDGKDISPEAVEMTAEMLLRADGERTYLFDHVWRQVADKFYDPEYHGVDWDAMRTSYAPLVGAVSNNRDFAILMSEMLGQLNASHTGMRYRPSGEREDDDTASLGAIFDLDGEPGLLIEEILPGGPLDRATLDVRPGDRIVAINGTALDANVNPFALLNRRAGERVRLTLDRDDRVIVTRSYSVERMNRALYERWIDRRRAIVEERSAGRLGYLHIRSMNDTGFRQTFSELFGRNVDREAVVVDTRFNGGGWLHDDLITLLSGESYFNLRPRGRIVAGAPEERWTRPSAVVMNEGNYSNAHMFPYAYDLFDIGPLVGMPVPGTATAVWWERQISGDLVFGIPQLPVLDQNNQPLENQLLLPDIQVDNPPEDAAEGLDRPLEAAVDALLATLDEQ